MRCSPFVIELLPIKVPTVPGAIVIVLHLIQGEKLLYEMINFLTTYNYFLGGTI